MSYSFLVISADSEIINFCKKSLKEEFSCIEVVNPAKSSYQAVYVAGHLAGKPDLVLFDFEQVIKSGFEYLQAAVRMYAPVPIIVISRAHPSIFAVYALKAGAVDFIDYPCLSDFFTRRIMRYVSAVFPDTFSPEVDQNSGINFGSLIGNSPQMVEVKRQLEIVSKSNLPVLLIGESGTGKTIAAKLIHENSSRKTAPFFEANIGALNENLADSELFGTVPGAYTGSVNRIGFFEKADKGTLFLDEIGDLTPSVQIKLLRIMENGKFRRLGSSDQHETDVRVVCATNASLKDCIKEKTFRNDLYFRLAVLPVSFPPLRDHKEDLPVLAALFAAENKKRLSNPVIEKLLSHDWPGNVRELHNCLIRACFLASTDMIGPEDIEFF